MASEEETERLVDDPIVTNFSSGYKSTGSFIKKPILKRDGLDRLRIVDVFKEQQMLRAINYINAVGNAMITESIEELSGGIADFYAHRQL